MIETMGRNALKEALIKGEAYSHFIRQERNIRLVEEELPMADLSNDADQKKIGVSKYVSDTMSDLDLEVGDYSFSITTDTDDEAKVAAIDLTLYGNDEFIGQVFSKLKNIFSDVIVKTNESLGRVTHFHCWGVKR